VTVFITFEGIEGCGKSTLAKRVHARLQSLGIAVIFTLEPGGTRIGQEIRNILLDPGNQSLSPLSELFLYEADRAQHVQEVIQPALNRGEWVVCDRFFDATTVYQGYARDQDLSVVRTLNEKASQGIVPNKTFVLDCQVKVGLERAVRREGLGAGGQDRFEREEAAFHEAIRKGYLALAREDPERFIVMDATLPEAELESLALEAIRPFLPVSRSGGG
jgi:dTMP kinase